MNRVTLFPVDNKEGEKLAKLIESVCDRPNMSFSIPERRINRADFLRAHANSELIIIDGSVESGHVYRVLAETIKRSKKYIILSRTPLPQNVSTTYQLAPIHGETLTNEELIEWLEIHIESIMNPDSISSLIFSEDQKEYDIG